MTRDLSQDFMQEAVQSMSNGRSASNILAALVGAASSDDVIDRLCHLHTDRFPPSRRAGLAPVVWCFVRPPFDGDPGLVFRLTPSFRSADGKHVNITQRVLK
jgi:hypothetical protein